MGSHLQSLAPEPVADIGQPGLLAVIPARRHSKGLPGKALRTVGGIPMVLRTLQTVAASGVADRIVVSTDWPELRDFCELRGFETLKRPPELATDEAPLAPVIRHAVEQTGWQGTVGVFQPTCPLLQPLTVAACVEEFDSDWMITASRDPHIHWQNGSLLTERVNRQELDVKVESGAIQLMTAAFAMTETGERTTIQIPPREALDIDTPDDLLLAERLVGLLRIHFVVAEGHEVGTGHVHRCRHLARVLGHHEVSWEVFGKDDDFLRRQAADVTVFDCLEVPADLLLAAKARGKVVVLEDEGAASGRLADLRVNEMLDAADLRYAVLREEFCCLPPREHFKEGRRILVTFGGTDPANLTGRVVKELVSHDLRVINPGTAVSMAREMREADLVVTGQGRTVMEAAATGTPCVSIAANDREARHLRIPGVTYLGLHSTVTSEALRHTIAATLKSKSLREEMARTARAQFDDRGADRLARAIEELVL